MFVRIDYKSLTTLKTRNPNATVISLAGQPLRSLFTLSGLYYFKIKLEKCSAILLVKYCINSGVGYSSSLIFFIINLVKMQCLRLRQAFLLFSYLLQVGIRLDHELLVLPTFFFKQLCIAFYCHFITSI